MAPGRHHKRLRVSPPQKSWLGLPPEIRNMILLMVDEDCPQSFPHESVASYAVVSLEWQSFFEHRTFRFLVLDYSALPAFQKAVSGKGRVRLSYLRHLWIRVKLFPYSCDQCCHPEDLPTVWWYVCILNTFVNTHSPVSASLYLWLLTNMACRNDWIFTKTMKALLQILASHSSLPGGMILEVSAHSPSDTQHFFRDHRIEDDYPFRRESDIRSLTSVLGYHLKMREKIGMAIDPSHQGVDPFDNSRPTFGEVQRFLGAPLDFIPLHSLPQAPIVKALHIRRQFYRQLSPTALAKLFRESLVSAESFRIERWCRPTPEAEARYMQGTR